MNTIFSVNIYKEQLNIKNKPLINYLLKLKKQDSKGRNISNPTGWQSFDLNVGQNVFLELAKEIETNFVKYINSIPLYNKFFISSMWGNINGYKDYNLPHAHGNSVISGVYYLKIPSESGRVCFYNPAHEGIDYLWEYCLKEFTPQNSSSWKIDVKDGDLLLFPSWLKHAVEPNLNKKEHRMSLAFNISIANVK
jgi:uncharacterized protein (TIGR02466 family)|tara:strand:- start:414 stop:995 length:582 start_codon:yes stop_codon:yes gene_type:complete